ncbi:MAG: TatD family hydrolase [Candidatus Aramenus sulfurataquae]|jgi:TatD DNase family protein|uniref:Hydrolase TatD n=2 Tax=Candidatus Aramenus sulfurataquae TaxID=1326980 RepID=A0A0F2LNF8_9CREN|nr:TatD family hydrolase [Candidatus Aramenus sulfurataquae]
MLIDVHAHLHTKDFDQDRDKVLAKCNVKVVEAGVDLESDLRVIELSSKYGLVPALGFHPEFVERSNEVDEVLKLLDKAKAISEVGLDYYWIKEEELKRKEVQVLERFLEEGERRNIPVIIHSRGGNKDLLSILPSYKVKFVIHAYEGSVKDALKFVDLGGFISFPPVIVRDKFRQAIAKEVPLENAFTETDSPFLGVDKGTRNEPCNVIYALKKIAELKGVEQEEVERKIEENFKKIFP